MTREKVGIVIVNWNGYEVTRKCLLSCGNLLYENYTIFIVDNNSEDGSVEKLKIEFPKFHYLMNETNKGFSGGVNPGIEAALQDGCHYVWLLNNDAKPSAECLSEMLRVANSYQNKCLVGSWIYKGGMSNEKKEIEVIGGGKINYISGRTKVNKFSDNYSLDYISGASMLIPKQVIKRIGVLDESFFMYYEDVDYSCRAKEDGFKLVVAESAFIWHEGSASTKGEINPIKDGYAAESCVIFFKKHGKYFIFPAIFAMTLRSCRRVFYDVEFACAMAIIRGVIRGLMVKSS